MHWAQKWLQKLSVIVIEEYTVHERAVVAPVFQSAVCNLHTIDEKPIYSSVFALNLVTTVVLQCTFSYALVPC